MSSAESAPVGQVTTMAANNERFNNAQANKLIAELQATPSVAKQHQFVDQLEQIAFEQVPIVGLVSGAGWNEYQTNHYVGWPDASHPYSGSLDGINALLIMTHLRPAQ